MKHFAGFLFAAAIFVGGLSVSLVSQAQKYACVNTEKVMKNLPDYVQAQQRLDRYVAEWQQEIEVKYQEYENLQKEYQQKVYLLPDNLKKHHEDQIKAKHQEIVDLQQQRFGVGGDLDKKKSELLKPVQDRVAAAIERVANEKNYAFVFDRSGTSTVLYANAKYDITSQVLDALGYKGGDSGESQTEADGKKSRSSSKMGFNDKKGGQRDTPKLNKK